MTDGRYTPTRPGLLFSYLHREPSLPEPPTPTSFRFEYVALCSLIIARSLSRMLVKRRICEKFDVFL